jgi:hypothetical protein
LEDAFGGPGNGIIEDILNDTLKGAATADRVSPVSIMGLTLGVLAVVV